jgi:hypothetical protein
MENCRLIHDPGLDYDGLMACYDNCRADLPQTGDQWLGRIPIVGRALRAMACTQYVTCVAHAKRLSLEATYHHSFCGYEQKKANCYCRAERAVPECGGGCGSPENKHCDKLKPTPLGDLVQTCDPIKDLFGGIF